jgi:putative nucleotidyltransferase with HDIG domain
MTQLSSARQRWRQPLPKAPWASFWELVQRPAVWLRVSMCVATALVLWITAGGWQPPFGYRLRQSPTRLITARVQFDVEDPTATLRARDDARRSVLCYYQNDQRQLEELREALMDRLFQIKDKPYAEVAPVWIKFIAGPESGETPTDPAPADFDRLAKALAADPTLDRIRLALQEALKDFLQNGLLDTLQHELGEGSTQEILVYSLGNAQDAHRVNVSQVRIAEVGDGLRARLQSALASEAADIPDHEFVAERLFHWLRQRLPVTLTYDETSTQQAIAAAERQVEPVKKVFQPRESLGIDANVPLTETDLELLRHEHAAFVAQMSLVDKIAYSASFLGMYGAMFCLLWGYLYFRDRRLVADLRHFSILLGLFLLTMALAWLASFSGQWRFEILPITMFAMIVAIAYHRELALLLGAIIALVFAMSHGYGMREFIVLMGTAATASLLCGNIRSRTRLVYVGLTAAAIALPTTLGVGIMLGQPPGWDLLMEAVWFAAGALLAGLLITAVLPFLERWFGVQTDISLLELSDANHPLLRQLVQRAPGTYNHSINVASIAEAAAEAIGANGLVCRVGAYFHDIGKMRKPEYFIENQVPGVNKHEQLVPTMSTLVIVAHVKDGVEMARRYHLPRRIIDLIEQHHGTTLVEFFYHRAAQQAEQEQATPAPIEEANFRYPGPKPQTPEAAVTMLADSVESACRSLRDPTPSRIDHVVRGILKKRLDDGQFESCPLTLKQLAIVEDTLIKTLSSMYHGRVQYPGQQTA